MGAKDISKRRSFHSHLGLVLLQSILAFTISDQAHGQLIRFEENGVWVGSSLGHCFAERVEGILANDSGVGKPFPVGLDSCDGHLFALELCRLCEISSSIVS